MTPRDLLLAGTVLLTAGAIGCSQTAGKPGQVLDEAMQARVSPADMKPADEDYFHDMDGGTTMSPEEVQGRNMWIVWTGGNDRFWDGMTASTFGAFDLLKIVAYDPRKKIDRDLR